MSFIDEEVMPNNETVSEQLCILNKQIFVSTTIIYVLFITIMVLKGYKKILCIEDKDKIAEITTYNTGLTRYTILIVLIVTFYYLYQSIQSYQDSLSCVDKNYVAANVLSVIAVIIRFWTIYSNDTANEIETDIVS